MQTDTHGNGNGLNDLYVLCETIYESGMVLAYLKKHNLSHSLSFSNVKGQAWYGKQFMIVNFAEPHCAAIEAMFK